MASRRAPPAPEGTDRFTWKETDRLTVEKPDGRIVHYNVPRPGWVRVVSVAGVEREMPIEEYEARERPPLQ